MTDIPPQDPWQFRPATDLDLSAGERLRSTRREPGLLDVVLGSVWWAAVRLHLRLYHRLSVQGREHLPNNPPFVLVANHASHMDALTLGAALPITLRQSAYPIGAGDYFFRSPWKAAFAATLINALPMERGRSARQQLVDLQQRLVAEPCGLILFPEGTRSRDGTMGRFKPGLGMLVAGTDIPVIPCHLAGANQALPPGKALPRPKKIRVRLGKALRFADTPPDKAGWSTVAAAAEAAVRSLA